MALLNGITMGGGGGISIPGTFRVATNKTVCTRDPRVIIFCLLFLMVHLNYCFLVKKIAYLYAKLNEVSFIYFYLADFKLAYY